MRASFWICTVGLAGLAACSTEPRNTSVTRDIATPGTLGAVNTMVWYDTDVVVAGECAVGQPIVRANCQTIRGRKAYMDVVNGVDQAIVADISAENAAHDAEVARLRDTDPVVQSLRQQITQLNADISTQTAANTTLTSNLTNLQATLQDEHLDITQTEQQISEVNLRLASDPGNQELLRLRDQLIAERQTLVSNHDATQLQINQTTSALQAGRDTIVSKTMSLQSKEAELNQRLVTLPVTSPALDHIAASINDLMTQRSREPVVLNQLRDGGLVYRTNVLTDTDNRIVMRIFTSVGGVTFPTSFARADVRQISGYLEVMYNGQWSGVCDDNFNEQAAAVACRWAGFPGTGSFSSASGPAAFWLDDLTCTGAEANLFSCGHAPVGTHNCGAGENVHLSCM